MKRIYLASPHMGAMEMKYIQEAFDTNWVAPLGPNVTGFEDELKSYINVKNNFPAGEKRSKIVILEITKHTFIIRRKKWQKK